LCDNVSLSVTGYLGKTGMKNWRVLLVDDEEEYRSTLAERLRRRGIQIMEASDGEEAFRMIETFSPNVVVLDVLMPGTGGLQVLKKIKTEHPEIQVILLTGLGTTQEGREFGAFDYLLKPIHIEKLIEKIGEALQHLVQ
jgi:two-component system, OmpR family, response regulator